MPDLQLHHIGFVVEDVERAIPGFERSLQAKWDGRIWEDPHQQAKVAFLDTGSALIELVAPWGDPSPVARFLQQGGGLHHLCYQVDSLDTEMESMRDRGSIPVRSPLPAVAFEGRRIAWLMTRERLLVELLERANP